MSAAHGRIAGLVVLSGVLLLGAYSGPPPRPRQEPGPILFMPDRTWEYEPRGAEATHVGWQSGQVTPTSCPWVLSHQFQAFEPVPWCLDPVLDATRTAGIADGSVYGYWMRFDGSGTPSAVGFYGTVPPHVMATWVAQVPTGGDQP